MVSDDRQPNSVGRKLGRDADYHQATAHVEERSQVFASRLGVCEATITPGDVPGEHHRHGRGE